jgi:hypothetical protein
MSSNKNEPIISALEKVYGPLIQLASKLPPLLAYGLAALIALLVAYVVTVFLGSVIPTTLLWFVLAIDVTTLLAFVFVDWNKRQYTARKPSSIDYILNSSVFYVVVHEPGDRTRGIADVEVTLALPEPITKSTASNGATNFTIPNDFIGKEFSLNARKSNYKARKPAQVTLRRQGYEFIELEPEQIPSPQIAPNILDTAEYEPKIIPSKSEILVYDSNKEEKPFISWTLFCTARGIYKHILIVDRDTDGLAVFKLVATSSDELVGVNKSFRTLFGRVEFEYKIEAASTNGPNIFFFMIPMQETGIGRTGLIEVGTNVEDDPRNAFSPYRSRFLVPAKHCKDGQWHSGSMEFDFRDTPEAFYSIFGPRINEGSVHPEAGVLFVTNIRLFSYEG